MLWSRDALQDFVDCALGVKFKKGDKQTLKAFLQHIKSYNVGWCNGTKEADDDAQIDFLVEYSIKHDIDLGLICGHFLPKQLEFDDVNIFQRDNYLMYDFEGIINE